MRKTTTKIIIHCSATKPSMDIGRDEIDRWHRARGWLGIGYHLVIRRDGSTEPGRAINDIGAHTRGHNSSSVGICLVGGVHETKMAGRWPKPETNFTEDQWEALDSTIDMLLDLYPDATVHGHNEFANKACPTFDVQRWMKERNQRGKDVGRAGPSDKQCPNCGFELPDAQ